MSRKLISAMVKTTILFLALTGVLCCAMMPTIVKYILPGFSSRTHLYWSIFLIISSIPCFCALVPAWKIADNIKKSKAFCKNNAKMMHLIGIFMAVDTSIIFLVNIIYFICRISFVYLFSAFFLIIAIFFALSVCSFALSSLIANATELQIQSDLTI